MGTARIAPGDLTGLDALAVDSLVLHMFAERRQPRAVAGYVDWRLCGRLARLLLSERFKGEIDEALLMPAQGRLGADRLFLIGLGTPNGERAKIEARSASSVQVLTEAGAKKVALGGASFVLEAWLAGAKGGDFDEVVLLDADGALLGSEEALKSAAQKSGFTWSVR